MYVSYEKQNVLSKIIEVLTNDVLFFDGNRREMKYKAS